MYDEANVSISRGNVGQNGNGAPKSADVVPDARIHEERSMGDDGMTSEKDNAVTAIGEAAPRATATKPVLRRSTKAVDEKADAQKSAGDPMRKRFTADERVKKLKGIERAIGNGESLKNAIKNAAISEQTYYLWKRGPAPVASGEDLRDLVALEEENTRLKALLANRLREENAELKKKLGLI